jgi:hypothetical protein
MHPIEIIFRIIFVSLGVIAFAIVFGPSIMRMQPANRRHNSQHVYGGPVSGTRLDRPVMIYYLADHNGKPFYAGRTNRTLNQRHREHIEDYNEYGTPKQRYIWLMHQLGEEPTIHHVQTVRTTEEEARAAEWAAIQKYGVTNVAIP